MPSVLLTAFEPYDRWAENASWLCLMELTRELPSAPQVTTRRYPVEFAAVRQRLEADLAAGYDVAIHLGQAPGSGRVQLERFAINAGIDTADPAAGCRPLAEDGPAAYRSALPLEDWAEKLRAAGIPAAVSYHAGTYLCNATLYWTHHVAALRGLPTRAAFFHLPLDVSQVVGEARDQASLPANISARAVRLILAEFAEEKARA
jgi:pyroglutamyl-peptidase